MGCLNDVEIQAVADNEATDKYHDHIAGCERCWARVVDRRREMARLMAITNEGGAPPSLETRVRQALASAPPVRGATALRGPRPSRRSIGWISAVATAAAIAIVVFGVLPKFGAPTELSAAQVIGRSLDRLTAITGVETLEYELMLNATPFRIYQVFDRANPGRYRIDQFNPDGSLHAAVSQDPASRSRSELVSVDGRRYIVRIRSLKEPLLSVPEMVQAQIEAVLTMLQATGDGRVTIVDAPQGKQYVVEMPAVSTVSSKAMLDLSSARAVIDAADFKIREFRASGTMLKQRFDVSFTLIQQVTAAAVAPQDFEIAAASGDIVLDGDASADPFHDSIDIVLRELGRLKVR